MNLSFSMTTVQTLRVSFDFYMAKKDKHIILDCVHVENFDVQFCDISDIIARDWFRFFFSSVRK